MHTQDQSRPLSRAVLIMFFACAHVRVKPFPRSSAMPTQTASWVMREVGSPSFLSYETICLENQPPSSLPHRTHVLGDAHRLLCLDHRNARQPRSPAHSHPMRSMAVPVPQHESDLRTPWLVRKRVVVCQFRGPPAGATSQSSTCTPSDSRSFSRQATRLPSIPGPSAPSTPRLQV